MIDKGAGKGALIYTERKITDKASGELIATVTQTTFPAPTAASAVRRGDARRCTRRPSARPTWCAISAPGRRWR